VIRVNLLGVERQKVKKASAFDPAARVTLACSLVLVAAVGGIGWWYWSLGQQAVRLDMERATAQREQARLRTLLAEVQEFEDRRSQLQQRVALIEQLRSGQNVPVQLLDHVSRSLPEMLWLTSFKTDGPAVTIEGRSTTLIGVSDFVGNLGATPLLQKPIQIVDSQVEVQKATNGQPEVEVIHFTVKAQVAPVEKPPTAAAGRGGRGGGGRIARGRAQGAGA
jgi:type IV pilus assembly protein PilN